MRHVLFMCLALTPLAAASAQENDSRDGRHSALRGLKLAFYKLAARTLGSQALDEFAQNDDDAAERTAQHGRRDGDSRPRSFGKRHRPGGGMAGGGGQDGHSHHDCSHRGHRTHGHHDGAHGGHGGHGHPCCAHGAVEAREAVETSGTPHGIRIELKENASGDQITQVRASRVHGIQLRIALNDEDDDDDDEDDGDDDDGDDDDGDDDDDENDDDDDDSIGQLRIQVELLRHEVHELHQLLERVVSEK